MDDEQRAGQVETKEVLFERPSKETNLEIHRKWEGFAKKVSGGELYGFLRQHNEHVFPDYEAMENYLQRVFVEGGTVVVDTEPQSNRIVGFADGRPQDTSHGKMLVISEVTSKRKSFQSIATLLTALIEQHSDCEALLFSLPQESEGDKRRARIYQRVGFQPDERFHSVASSERVCYSMSIIELKQKLELLTKERR